jgi:hypothetical protein
MQRIQLPDDRITIAGAIDVDDLGDGVQPRRLSNKWRYQFPMEVDILCNSLSGVRLAFVTDSSSVGIEVLATHLVLGSTGEGYPAAIDLHINREPRDTKTFTEGHKIIVDADTGTFSFENGEPTTITFDNVDSSGLVELWLPSSSMTQVRAVVIDDGASISAAPEDARRKWVHHGSSISHCLEAQCGARAWPSVAARLANVNVTNLGLGGQCHLDQFTARTIRDTPADLLSLKVGINIVNGDTLRARTFPSALHGFLDTIREGHPDTPFLIVSPIYCPPHEDHAGPSDGRSGKTKALGTDVTEAQGALTLKQIREIVRSVVAARVAYGDKNLHYLDGLQLFGEADAADLPDDLHPNEAGYYRMGERFAAIAFADGAAFGA